MAVTIKDIATRLNISVSTVSYALNGGPRPVPEAVRERVLEAARELNYRPNRVARSMITGRSHTIGVVPPGITHNVFLSPYLQHALSGVANAANDLHQDLVIFTRFEAADTEAMLGYLLDGRVDGAIFIAPSLSEDATRQLAASGLPCVCVSIAPHEGLPSFSPDNEGGIRLVMEHLFALGHRRFAHIAGRPEMDDAIARRGGFEAFLRSQSLPCPPESIVNGDFTMEGGALAMAELLRRGSGATAIVCANDEMAVGAMHTVQAAGLRVPEDISITGFDMSPYSGIVQPPITTVSQPVIEIAAAATSALVALVEGQEPPASRVFPTELVVRASTARPQEDLLIP
ncbi:MAG: LacI family DNA-binding transcriptional regulator [Fimbriimonadaceae bacterium]|nr:LacI family DNA-binding transcriptional regulator [Fimbriimonadaceae bacterium]